ncbi:Olfactory receptor 5W2 [Lemmus lemmus]
MKHEEYEAESNISTVTQFVLLGFASLPNLQGILSAVFSIIYMIILIGNCLIILITRLDPTLHKPMYFFLANFSILEICYVSVTVPRILFNIWTQDRTISVLACAVQMCFFLMLGTDECFLLAVMSYDRYVAICNPLQYPLNMSSMVCSMFMAGVYLVATTDGLIHTTLAFRLCFCGSNVINHFFCDLPPLYLLSCSDIQVNELALFTVFGFIELSTISGVLVSYCYIILSVLKIRSAEGRFKAFSTCTSHLTTVAIFQGTMLFMYFRPSSSYSLDQDKMTSLFYTLVIPMLNPLIYSLRNTDVKEALQKLKMKMCL